MIGLSTSHRSARVRGRSASPAFLDEAPVLAHWRGRLIVVALVFLVVVVFAVIQVLSSADRGARALRAINQDIEAFSELFAAQAALDELKRSAFELVQTRSEWALTETERAQARFLAMIDRLPEADEIDRKALAYNAGRVRDLLEDVVARSVFANAARMADSMHALRALFAESSEILRNLHEKQVRVTADHIARHARSLSAAVTRTVLILAFSVIVLIALAGVFDWLATRRQRYLRRYLEAMVKGARDIAFGPYDVRTEFGRMLSCLEQLQQHLTDLELENSSARLELMEGKRKQEQEIAELKRQLADLSDALQKAEAREEALRDILSAGRSSATQGAVAPAEASPPAPVSREAAAGQSGEIHPLRGTAAGAARP
ncbi:MAG: hypothetical protein D6740_06435 [Alphaproteobacteria bacterium]|nr:MAG: hypothetical protein D6740_06435 [Alphaproteobacteria bacterium]